MQFERRKDAGMAQGKGVGLLFVARAWWGRSGQESEGLGQGVTKGSERDGSKGMQRN